VTGYAATRIKIKTKAKTALSQNMRLCLTAALCVIAIQFILTLLINPWYPEMMDAVAADQSANLILDSVLGYSAAERPVSLLLDSLLDFTAAEIAIILLLETVSVLILAPLDIGIAELFLKLSRNNGTDAGALKLSGIFGWYLRIKRSLKAFLLQLLLKLMSSVAMIAAVAAPAYFMFRIESQSENGDFLLDMQAAGFYTLSLLAAALLSAAARMIVNAWMPAVYILAQNPETGVLKAIGSAMRLMRGHKFEYLVFQLSFIPWYIGAGVTFGLLMLYIIPYQNMAEAMFVRSLEFERESARLTPPQE